MISGACGERVCDVVIGLVPNSRHFEQTHPNDLQKLIKKHSLVDARVFVTAGYIFCLSLACSCSSCASISTQYSADCCLQMVERTLLDILVRLEIVDLNLPTEVCNILVEGFLRFLERGNHSFFAAVPSKSSPNVDGDKDDTISVHST